MGCGKQKELAGGLDAWLRHYNFDRPHRGYRNQGRRPVEAFELGKKQREEIMKKAA